MLKAIAKNDPRLYVALSGNYIKGFGYDGNNDGKIELKSSTLHLTQADFTNGLYELSEYDSDELKPLDAADYWMGIERCLYHHLLARFGQSGADSCRL